LIWGYKRYFIAIVDIVLILVSTQLAVWVRFSQLMNWISIYWEAILVSILIYILILYIFDMYNIQRIKDIQNMIIRITASFIFSGILLTFIFYFFPGGKFGRGIFFIQLSFSWLLLSGWRLLFAKVYRYAIGKQKLLIIGAGKSARYLMDVLDPDMIGYEIIGLLDDDPQKQGRRIGLSKVIGYVSQFNDIINKIGPCTTVVAITKGRKHTMVSDILQARIKGITVVEMPNLFEAITGRIPVKHIHDSWLLFSEGFLLFNKEFR